MRNHLAVKRAGHLRDAHELRDAGVAHLGLHDRHCTRFETRQVFVDGAQFLAQCNGHPCACAATKACPATSSGAHGASMKYPAATAPAHPRAARLPGRCSASAGPPSGRCRCPNVERSADISGDDAFACNCSHAYLIPRKPARNPFFRQGHALGQRGFRQARHVGRNARVTAPRQAMWASDTPASRAARSHSAISTPANASM